MFLWTGGISQALWVCAFFTTKVGSASGDFAPVFVYSALATAGLILISSDSERSRNLKPRRFGEARGVLAPLDVAVTDVGQNRATRTQTKYCRVMTIGPLGPIQSVLALLDRSILVGHAETAGKALEKLNSLSTVDIPDVLIMPSWLPVVSSSDLVRAIKSDQTLNPIHIMVWGDNLPLKETQSLYDAGATCVISIPFDGTVAQALRRFCARI
jgi:CheY-like chemotaxis protein